MNKRGITLAELIISVSLISIVVLFLFRMLVEVKYSDNRIDYDRDNQQKRAIIIKRIQDDFLAYDLIGLNDNGSNRNKLIINFQFLKEDRSSVLSVENKKVTYTNALGDTEIWELEEENAYYQVTNIEYESEFDKSDFFSIWIRIPLIYKRDSNNIIDDLEFTYIGKQNQINKDQFPDTNILN